MRKARVLETYDGATDNLLSRKRNNDPQESFGYDNLDRLVSVKSGAAETMKISYAPNGNILFKTGVGNFSYDKNVRPHAVTEVENTDGKIPGDALTTSFNDFGKIQLIEDAGKSLRMDFSYGPDQERWYSELSKNDTDVRTTVYAGEYEKITENGVTREFYYLDGNTIVIRENGTVRNYHAFTDNLGSILCVMDENGTKVFDASYDAWGKQTVTLNSIGLHRGYTAYWYVIAPESFANATLFPSSHHRYWTETWANYLAKGHFRGLWIGGVDYPIKNISTFNWWKMKLAQMQGIMITRVRYNRVVYPILMQREYASSPYH